MGGLKKLAKHAKDAATGVSPELLSNAWDGALDAGNQFVQDMLSDRNHEVDAPTVDAAEPWSPERLQEKLDWRYRAADGEDLTDSDRIKGLMATLSEKEPEDPAAREAWDVRCREAALRLNQLRGNHDDTDLAMMEYNRFRMLQEQAAERGGTEALNAENAEHMGSIQQLRYGSHVGEILDVDPVYGALLNPTGGLIGPGNNAHAAPAESVASYHGEAHDAFGYLKSFHDTGPGYMYATPGESEKYADTDVAPAGPLTGQQSGFELWRDIFGSAGRFDKMTPMSHEQEMDEAISGIPAVEPLRGLPGAESFFEHAPTWAEGVEEGIHGAGGLIDDGKQAYESAKDWLFD